jgi:homoserine kinase type II
MAVYTHLSNERIAQVVQETYGLGELLFAVGIAQGVENTNYLLTIRTPQGLEIRTILTLYEKRVKPEDLPFFLGLMQHLHGRGIACPQPLATKEGALLTTIEGKHAAMVSFLSGRSRSVPRNAHMASLGGAVAALHAGVEGYGLRRQNTLSLIGWQQLYRSMEGQLNQLQESLAAMVADELTWLEAHWPQHLPRGIIHADLFPDNVFFEGDTVSGIIDFYFACEDAFAYDLAIVMNAWCFEHQREFNLTKSGLLLAQYAKVRPLSHAEREALPVLCRGAALRFLLTRAYDALHTQPGAMVQVKDPLEYVQKLRFHQRVQSVVEYGL